LTPHERRDVKLVALGIREPDIVRRCFDGALPHGAQERRRRRRTGAGIALIACSKPVAMTVTRTSSFMPGTMTVPTDHETENR
jgi:hypothetical protein